MDVLTGFDELLKNLSIAAPDLVPALAIPTIALVVGTATALGWNGPHLMERVLEKYWVYNRAIWYISDKTRFIAQ